MSRRSFDALPPRAQEVIREFSGVWTAERYIATSQSENDRVRQMLSADPGRRVVIPSPRDRDRADALFAAVVEEWLARDPRHAELLAIVQNEILNVRLGL
jgi:TRAP-type C4-dicarboxylate transport system substrate-binding protein